MKFANLIARFGNAIDTLYAAGAVAAALENNHRPRARDLDRLGIDRRAFETIRLS